MRKNLLVLLLGMAPFAGQAEVVTQTVAEELASRFFQGDHRLTRGATPPLKLVWKGQTKMSRGATEAPAFYVFNRGENGGFVIVAGDDAVAPILGYAHRGSFGTAQLPDNLKGWMNAQEERIETVRRQQVVPSSEVKAAWENLTVGVPVVELKTPEWNQLYPYHYYVPTVTGCTITAAAQIMGYHQWPDAGEGVLRGYTQSNGTVVAGVTLGYPYLWDKMPFLNGETEIDYNNALLEGSVATLMRDVGVMVHASYTSGGTTAMPSEVAEKLPVHMKYREQIVLLNRVNFSSEVWTSLLKYEIDQKRPVFYAGYGAGGGHSFVLDGYDSAGNFYVNWGWGGTSNGFFHIDALDPEEQGTGGSGAGYNLDQEAVMRIQPLRPNETPDFYENMVFSKGSFWGSSAQPGLHIVDAQPELTPGSTFTVCVGGMMNLGSVKYENLMKLAITDPYSRVKTELYTTPGSRHLMPGRGGMPMDERRDHVEVTLPNEIGEGDRIRLLYASQDGQWKPVTTLEADIPWEIELKPSATAEMALKVTTTAGTNLGGRAVATFSAEQAMTPSDPTVEAFYAEVKDHQTIVLKQIRPTAGKLIIPANTGVVLSTTGSTSFTMVPVGQNVVNVPFTNLLRPTSSWGTTVDAQVNAYILGKRQGEVRFHVLSDSQRTIGANRSYLALPPAVDAFSVKMVFDGEVTGVEDLIVEEPAKKENPHAPIYDLSGRRVLHPVKGGIYIQNGKKFIK